MSDRLAFGLTAAGIGSLLGLFSVYAVTRGVPTGIALTWLFVVPLVLFGGAVVLYVAAAVAGRRESITQERDAANDR